jgi:hypothetical protein
MATSFGAIRWDAWYSTAAGAPAVYVNNNLAQKHFQYRAPFWTKVLSDDEIVSCGDSISMEREIRFAAQAGIYWAFLQYSAGSPMNNGYDLFQRSPTRNTVSFCLATQADALGTSASWTTQANYVVDQMAKSNYKKVLSTRPLLIFYPVASDITSRFTDNAGMKVVLDYIKARSVSLGYGNPYLLVLSGHVGSTATALGADGISAYSPRLPNAANGTWSDYKAVVEAYWDEMKATSLKMAPLCGFGWDTRPRRERPVPWQTSYAWSYIGNANYYAECTPAQAAAHVAAAKAYLAAYPTECEAQTILSYAWNEFDEGGWICPTLGDPTGLRLSAISAVL